MNGIILRVIIDNKHLTLDTFKGPAYTLQAGFQIMTHIVADNHDA
jgi:hypothetical protein